MVLDEPNANLDAEGEAALRAALAELKARGVTVIMVGHRPALMSQLDKLAVLTHGVLEAFGPAATVVSRLRAAASSTAQGSAARCAPRRTRARRSSDAASRARALDALVRPAGRRRGCC